MLAADSTVRSINAKSNDPFPDTPPLLDALADEVLWDDAASRAIGARSGRSAASTRAREDLHRQAAYALASVPGREVQAAHHALTAGTSIPFGDVVEIVVRAGIAMPDRAVTEAEAYLYERAIDRFSAVASMDASTLAWLHIARYRALDESGDDRTEASFRAAIDQIRVVRDPHLATELGEARLSRVNDGDDRLRTLLLSALDWLEPGDHETRAALLAQAALEMAEWVGGSQPADLAAEAWSLVTKAEHSASYKVALRAVVATSYGRMRADERLDLSAEMLEVAFRTSDPDYHLLGLSNRLLDLYSARRFDEVEMVSAELLLRSRERRRPRFGAMVLVLEAAFAGARGDEDRRRHLLTDLRAECGAVTFADIEQALLGQEVLGAWRLGQLGEYADSLDVLWETGPRSPVHAAALAASMAAVGRSDRSRRVLVDNFGSQFELVPQGSLHLSTLATATAAVVELQDESLAQALLLQFSPHRGTDIVVAGGGGVFGPVETFTGELHRVLGNHDQSRQDLLAARAACQRSGFAPLTARLDQVLASIPG